MIAIHVGARRALSLSLSLLGIGLCANASAATFVVLSTADTAGSTCSTGCTLRQAINAANDTPAADVIHFSFRALAGPEVLIQPGSPLPTITQPVTIDGYSAVNTSVNTLAEGSNAVLRIRIHGTSAGANASGLSICANDVTIKGLSVTGFAQNGLAFGRDQTSQICAGVRSGGVVVGNFIGLAVNGLSAAENGGSGVAAVASQVRIGGPLPEERNVISGNGADGVRLSNAGSAASQVLGNLIGTDKSGTLPRGNDFAGVGLTTGVSPSVIGTAAAPNRIAHNGKGITATSSTTSGQTWFANRIHDNTSLGIDLGDDGVTTNDGNDGDPGPNGLQNFPLITAASRTATGVTANLTLEVGNAALQNYRIALYASAACDTNGHGEGEQLLINQLRALSTSNESFVLAASVDPLPPGTVLTATATATFNGSTSEFSQCFALDPPPIVVNSISDADADGCGDSECTLREAITAANADPNESSISFNIQTPASGERLIELTTPLPTITAPVLIDGYTQPDAEENADPMVSTAVLRVRVDGAAMVPAAPGFSVCADNVTIRGLAITRFDASGIAFGLQNTASLCNGAPLGGQVSGSFLGLATDGATPAGNSVGVLVQSGNPLIGGAAPSDRNVIASNDQGVSLSGASAGGSQVLNNLIGSDRGATLNRGNTIGIAFGGSPASGGPGGVIVGAADAPNRIAFNTIGIGTLAFTGSGNRWFANRFLANDTLGIDLVSNDLISNAVTPNDTNDVDTGANGGQNFPELTRAVRSESGLTVGGTLDVPVGTSNASYTLAIYASASCDGLGFGEGERFLGSQTVSLTQASAESFNIDFVTDDPLPTGSQITATATAPNGSSSEFSACLAATDPPPGLLVTSTADTDGATCAATCTLRQAINAANAQAGPDRISFDLPGIGPFVITLVSSLPTITGPVVIDGYTQIGSSANTAEIGSNAKLLVAVNGPNNAQGFSLCADDVVIRGLSIAGVSSAVSVGRDASAAACPQRHTGAHLAGNFFALQPDGLTRLAGGKVQVDGAEARIGGSALSERNMFASVQFPLSIFGSGATGTTVMGNYFGTDASGQGDLGSSTSAIGITDVADITIGDPSAPNVLAHSAEAGIFASSGSSGIRMFANEFSDHGLLPIFLCGQIPQCLVLALVNDPDDVDIGPNGLQNFPVLATALTDASGVTVTGRLDVPAATANAPYTIALYENAACDSTCHCEAEIFLGAQTVTLSGNPASAETFSVTLAVPPPDLGRVITSTATAPDGSTSALSACVTVTAAPQDEDIFANGFEGS